MKKLNILILMVLSVGLFSAAPALANSTFTIEGQKFIWLKKITLDSILKTAARTDITDAEKRTLVKASLDADAVGGYCATAIRIYAQAPRPTAAKVQEACDSTFNDSELVDSIVEREYEGPGDPSAPKMSVRKRISAAISGSIYILAMGGF